MEKSQKLLLQHEAFHLLEALRRKPEMHKHSLFLSVFSFALKKATLPEDTHRVSQAQ